MRVLSFGVLVFALAACASESDSSAGNVAPAALKGPWALEDARDVDGGRLEVLFAQGPSDRPTLDLRDDGSVSAGGGGGCNRMSSDYRIDSQGRLIIEDPFWTLVACDEERHLVDYAIRDLLVGATEWSIEESLPERLRLNHVDGHTSVWVAREPSEP